MLDLSTQDVPVLHIPNQLSYSNSTNVTLHVALLVECPSHGPDFLRLNTVQTQTLARPPRKEHAGYSQHH